MREIIINALRLKYKGIMAEAQANIEIYLEKSRWYRGTPRGTCGHR